MLLPMYYFLQCTMSNPSGCKTQLYQRHVLADSAINLIHQRTIAVERFAVLHFRRSLPNARLQSARTDIVYGCTFSPANGRPPCMELRTLMQRCRSRRLRFGNHQNRSMSGAWSTGRPTVLVSSWALIFHSKMKLCGFENVARLARNA